MLKTSCIPVCSYCGKQWPKNEGTYLDVPEEVKREVDKHVQQCPKNPLVQKIDKLLAACKAGVSSFGIRDAFLLPNELDALRLMKQIIKEVEGESK